MSNALDDEIRRQAEQQRAAAAASKARLEGLRQAREEAFARVEPELEALFRDTARRLSGAPTLRLQGKVTVRRSREITEDVKVGRGLLLDRWEQRVRTVTESFDEWQIVDHGWPIWSLAAYSSEVGGSLERPVYRHSKTSRLVLVVTTDGVPAITCRKDVETGSLVIGPWDNRERFYCLGPIREYCPQSATVGEIIGRIKPPVSDVIRGYFRLGKPYPARMMVRNPYHPLGEAWADELVTGESSIDDVPQLLRTHLAKTVVAIQRRAG